MKEKSKKKSRFRWLAWLLLIPVLAGALFVGMHALSMEGGKHEKRQVAVAQFHQGEKQFSRVKQEQSWGGEKERGRHGEGKEHEEEWDGMPVAFGAELLLLIAGWLVLRKSEGSKAKRWTGLALVALGALPLLPVIALVAGAVWLYKRVKQQDELVPESFGAHDFPEISSQNAALLDQWEQNIRKEEK
ncbi:hypothetical protein [Ectobacillus ponti]|uniref:Uncharacterized protein n=1 Tax=Ectobacillus ponti TaxID=2961894 RepID=A0AA42BNM3_9BACI|nr:hypothetical protein [Ectobacillus ponti]MCP8967827.1 hypothetical protein [Ectobacillus ponti]